MRALNHSLPLLFPLSLTLFGFLASCESKVEEGATEAECSDAVDNDDDGLLDCDDPGCAEGWEICGGDTDADADGDADGDTDSDTDTDADADFTAVVIINEFMASNASTVADLNGAYPDWIELYNLSDEPIDLLGYTMTDNLEEPEKHEFTASIVLPANGWLLLFADGDTKEGAEHVGFNLARDGEDIGIYDPQGRAHDLVNYGSQATDWSAARFPDGTGAFQIDESPTVAESNGSAP